MISLLSSQNLTKSYGPLEILRGISLSIDAGESIAIMGPSGSGKSTLLHILGTLDSPSSGTLEIGGKSPADLADTDLSRFRNQTIGFVFQDAHLLPQFSVLENVLLPIRAIGKVGDPETARATQLLLDVGLEERANHLPGQLSGGERQRAAIARSLIMQPRLLLCDEPTGNLDATTADQITDVLLHSGVGPERALIVITHSDALARRMSRHLELRDGQCFEA